MSRTTRGRLVDLAQPIRFGQVTHPGTAVLLYTGGDSGPSRAHRAARPGVLVLEHLTGLANVPGTGARLHAAPPAWHGIGTWPVRAYAVNEEDEG